MKLLVKNKIVLVKTKMHVNQGIKYSMYYLVATGNWKEGKWTENGRITHDTHLLLQIDLFLWDTKLMHLQGHKLIFESTISSVVITGIKTKENSQVHIHIPLYCWSLNGCRCFTFSVLSSSSVKSTVYISTISLLFCKYDWKNVWKKITNSFIGLPFTLSFTIALCG
jgi:hypothetical protein